MLGYVNYDIDISFIKNLNLDFQNLCKEIEDADKNNNLALYINDADAIDVGGKILCMNGCISSTQWDLLLLRYCELLVK